SHIVIENLDIRSGRPPSIFTNDSGGTEAYADNAAASYGEKAEHLTIRNCILRDSGNGLFVGAYDGQTRDLLIERNWIYDNGIEGSYYEHNTYTAAIGITYQFNRMGRLREGCGGNNLKDRSAGLVVRYNWIEDGNRQLDLVDAEDSANLVNHPDYSTTFVYGNILVESEGEGNSQILHYGGDSGTTADYRKGILYFFHNTVVSTRSGNTTLMRLSTNDEAADVRNNIIYTTAPGTHLALLADAGMMDLRTSWLMDGWVDSHSGLTGSIIDHGTNFVGTDPGFHDFASQDFSPTTESTCKNAGGPLAAAVLQDHIPAHQYSRHMRASDRVDEGPSDLGAFVAGLLFADGFEIGGERDWTLVVY
ncbi:MAG: polysaccharide-degrading enzyme, partial [Acidobacteriota bacterium]